MRWEDGCNGAMDGEARGVWCTLNDELLVPLTRNDSYDLGVFAARCS